MTTATFLRCIKRFAVRRGLPRKFLSDNARNFKSAAKVLRTVCDHPDVRGYLSLAGIDWNFNLEKAPWWGWPFRENDQIHEELSLQGGGKSKVLV